jgi:quinolinate synthase
MATLISPSVLTDPCPLDNYLLSPDHSMDERIASAREALGERVIVVGHHYQRDEVIRFADITGDSFQLSRRATEQTAAEYIVYCGVHFMAESADILRAPHQQVILPDLNAGCSMADMADETQVEEAWRTLEALGIAEEFLPITYMNSTAFIKAFCGERGGLVCTSSNAPAAFQWAYARRPRILFLPDQHLGRNTGAKLGIPLQEMIVWDPNRPLGGNDPERIRNARVLLWKGHCSVHQRFRVEDVDTRRRQMPDVTILVHPECSHEVVQKADMVGSTEFIIRQVNAAPPGSRFAIGTEIHLVNRLAQQHPEKQIVALEAAGCPLCSTMYRISPQHLAWVLENLLQDRAVNVIRVPEPIRHWARVGLERMLSLVP